MLVFRRSFRENALSALPAFCMNILFTVNCFISSCEWYKLYPCILFMFLEQGFPDNSIWAGNCDVHIWIFHLIPTSKITFHDMSQFHEKLSYLLWSKSAELTKLI